MHPVLSSAGVCLPSVAAISVLILSRIAAVFRARHSIVSRAPRLGSFSGVARRLVHFWIVWSALLLVHETGHAVGAWRQGLEVRRITAGIGPVMWQGDYGDTDVVIRLVPLAGVTSLGDAGNAPSAGGSRVSGGWSSWTRDLATILGGVVATLALAMTIAGVVAARERRTARIWRWGRYVVADALVLTLFNFLPVPPLDGGRIMIGALAAWRGVHLSGDALFWVQLSGLGLAVIPMTLWTRWTACIDAFTLRWGAPAPKVLT